MIECKTASSPSRLPGLDRALNPYRGCRHGCVYCYAQDVTRFEPGRTWGDVVEVKENIVHSLRRELEKPFSGVYGIGTVTDPYQPLEKKCELSRGCLSVLTSRGARVSVLTKSPLILRDMDLLKKCPGTEVGISLCTVDPVVASVLEPNVPNPEERLAALSQLADAGIDVYLMAAPLVPGLSDSDDSVSSLVEAAARAGVRRMIWDRYNPKPIAHKRLLSALARAGLGPLPSRTAVDRERLRASVVRASSASGISLEDAF